MPLGKIKLHRVYGRGSRRAGVCCWWGQGSGDRGGPLSKERLRQTKGEGQRNNDWALCLIRWGMFVCALVVALIDPTHPLSSLNLVRFLLAFGAYNLTITLLLTVRFLLRAIPIFTLIADTVTLVMLLALSGGAESPFFFFPLFPILVAALRFGWLAGVCAAAVFIATLVLHQAFTWEAGQGAIQFFKAGLYSLLFLFAAAVSGSLSPHASSAELRRPSTSDSGHQLTPDRYRMVVELAFSLSASLNYERVLETILEISRFGFDELGLRVGESVGLILLYDADGYLSPASYRNLVVREDETRRIKGRDGILELAIGSAEAIIGGPPSADPELRLFESLKPCKSMICVPLRAGFETYGAVLFASTRPNAYTAEHVELLTIFCNQATIALQNASLYQSLQKERDKIIDKEEQARRKLARDLHDGPTQDLAAIAMRLNFARLLLDRDVPRAKAELARLEDLAHRTVKEIRSMLFTLRPVILETEGLVAALNQYADNLRETEGLPVTIDAERFEDCLDTDAQGVVFAIIEEAVNNARKHAQATHIWVRLAVQDDMFLAQVADNGRGFDVEAVESRYGSRGSLGLINLKERAQLVGGTINIESAPGQGTKVTLLVPIKL